MKKLLSLALMIMFVVTLAACDGTVTLPTDVDLTTVPETEEPTDAPTTDAPTTDAPTTDAPTTAGDTTPPVITGTQDVEIFINSTFDPMDGVSATDDVDGDITDQITVSSTALLESGMLDTSKTGDFFVRYTVEDSAGNPAEQLIMISIVIDPSQLGDEMIQNGDFELGAGVWTLALNEGGAGDFSVIEEEGNQVGVVNITAAGWTNPFPRLDSNVTEFENGKTYQVSFMAKADAPRPISVRVGELLGSAPWFVDYKPFVPTIFDLTTEWYTYTFKFTMSQDADLGAMLDGALLFEHGITIEGDVAVPEENYVTKVYYDDVVITETEPDPDTEGPVISGTEDVEVVLNSTFDPLAGVTAGDAVDGPITLEASNVTGTVDTSVAGEYTLIYTVSDAAGNESTATRTVTVIEQILENWIAYGDYQLEYVLDYNAVPTPWYNWNLQGLFKGFDPTNTTFDITFIGEDTQTYLFKVEGGGQAAEQAITADGTEQTVSIDLSAMTEEQRAGLNLMVIFAQSEGESGTLAIKPIADVEVEWTAYGDMSLTKDITYGAVASEWWNSNLQGVIGNFDGTIPVIEFTFIGEAGQDYTFKVEDFGADPAVAVEATFTATGAVQTEVIDLSGLTAEQRAELDLIIIFAITESATGRLSIVDWGYPDWIAYNNINVTETASGAEITYDAVPATVWDNNVQTEIESFDGTKESVIFTVTGVAGHEYLIKVEGEGQSAETQFVATGSSEEVTIDLSSMTEEERNGLSLVVVFVIEAAESGTLLVEGWDYPTTTVE